MTGLNGALGFSTCRPRVSPFLASTSSRASRVPKRRKPFPHRWDTSRGHGSSKRPCADLSRRFQVRRCVPTWALNGGLERADLAVHSRETVVHLPLSLLSGDRCFFALVFQDWKERRSLRAGLP